MDDTRDTPPRGKVFAVTRFSHVAGGQQRLVVGERRYETRKQALSAMWDIDPRLDPRVGLVDRVERKDFSDIA